MEAGAAQVRELMRDIRAVEWLPMDAAVARLSRGYERVFLENVGPIAFDMMSRQWKEKAPAGARRREAAVTEPQLPFAESSPAPQPSPGAESEIALSPDEAEPVVPVGDGEAMPPRHQRASFAERVRNWLGGGA
jgi:8-oxo-dGTP diphosphatase